MWTPENQTLQDKGENLAVVGKSNGLPQFKSDDVTMFFSKKKMRGQRS